MKRIDVEELGEYIREQRKLAEMSLRQLAASAEVSNPYLSQIERGMRKPSAEILSQIAKGLRISAETLYVRAGILDEVRGDASVTAALQADESITDRQRQVLQEIYAAFQKENAGAQIAAMASAVATNSGSDVEELGRTQLVETNKHHHTANALAPSDA
ncbi:MAG: helix-turn-helix transcriptional regulator [Candidatus Nanopelagicales bacterium]